MFAIKNTESGMWLSFVRKNEDGSSVVKLSFDRAKTYDREEVAKEDLKNTGAANEFAIVDTKLIAIDDSQTTFWKRARRYVKLADGRKVYDVKCAKCGNYGLRGMDGAMKMTPYCPFCGRKIVKHEKEVRK